ncbi:MAG: hypothetical protein ACFFBD_24785 [Candidatus Hodarchaeota archaeon]
MKFRNILSELSGDRIIILSTHIVSDVEAAATNIALINQGRLLKHGTPEELMRNVDGKVWEAVVPSTELMNIKKYYLISNAIRQKDGVHVRIVADARPSIPNLESTTPTLEEAYLYHVKSNHRGE